MSKTEINHAVVADQLMEISALFAALSGSFRHGAASEVGGSGDGAPAKPVRGAAGKPAASKPAAKKAAPEPEPEDEGAELTEDDVREALKELAGSKGKETMLAALEHVGAGKLAEVDESQYGDLMDKIKELTEAEEAEPAPVKKSAKKPAKKAGPTLEELTDAAKALIDADKPAYLKLVKKFGKPSEVDEDQYAAMLEAIQAAMPNDGEGDDDLL